jgi:chemotaxis protein CheD
MNIAKTQPNSYLKVYLHPGEVCIADNPTEVWTLLGSCLAIIFYHPHRQLGAIAHAQLPEKSLYEGSCSQKCSDYCPKPCYHDTQNANPYKYVSCSLKGMLDAFEQRGVFPGEIDVKLFGGSSILPLMHPVKSVGQQNIEMASKLIEQYHLHLVSQQVGGITGRTLYFYSDTGEVLVKPHRTMALMPKAGRATISTHVIS